MKRLPKGFGSVYKLKGGRRKPYCARIPYTKDGKTKHKYLGYYTTFEEAMVALCDFNRNPYNMALAEITIADLWRELKKRKEGVLAKGTMRDYESAYKHLSSIWDTEIIKLKTYHLQQVIDNMNTKWQTKNMVKGLLFQLFTLAIEFDIVNKNYASFIKTGEKTASDMHKPFEVLEIRKLWESAKTNEFAELPLILCYTGMRPAELLEIRKENVHLSENYMI